MEMGKAGPRVVLLMEEPHKLDASLSETQRFQALAKQIQEMLRRGRVRTKNAVFCVPGQSVFVRRIKLPKTTPERLSRIIRFEARQQIPFPLDKTIMEYQVFDEGDPNEVNVLLVAIKRDYILNFMKMVRRSGLRPMAISVSSLALYNFHELNGSKRLFGAEKEKQDKARELELKKNAKAAKGKKKNDAEPDGADPGAEEEVPLDDLGFDEIQAYVNLGATLMDLAIPKPGLSRMIGFTRSVPLAGNEMDRAIREKLNLEDPGAAQRIKETEAVILSTEFEVDGDPKSVNLDASEAVTLVADRLISELRRSLDFYISQPDGVAVDSIVLSGGLARLRHLGSYIEEKMGLPVQLAEPKHPQLRMPDAPPDPFCPFAICVGLGLQGLGLAQNTINFLPEDIKNVRGLQDRRFEVAGMGVMLLVMIAMSWTVGSTYILEYKKQIDADGQRIALIVEISDQITQAQDRNKKVADAYEKLSKATSNRNYWFAFLKSFLDKRPTEVLIDEIQMRLDGTVIVKGKSPAPHSVRQFLDELNKATKDIFASNINYMNPVRDPRFQSEVYDFALVIQTWVRRGRIRTIGDQPAPPPKLTPLQIQQQQQQNNPNPYGGYGGGAQGNPNQGVRY